MTIKRWEALELALIIWVVVANIFYFHPYLGKWSNLTSIFFRWVGSTTNYIAIGQVQDDLCMVIPKQPFCVSSSPTAVVPTAVVPTVPTSSTRGSVPTKLDVSKWPSVWVSHFRSARSVFGVFLGAKISDPWRIQVCLYIETLLKNNMEHNHGGLEDHFPF